ncbi:uncharacterized protein A4U43_C01F31230 [Asparagus officinalis]|uniref:Cytochrome P450 n=1 Tax=Asparagus officinalis TaxID=4686 RepID=A0A5P1FTI7_ASPOF|nr:uncharacterized protein A4U43_C01F31230 [Asparagus officinalis]
MAVMLTFFLFFFKLFKKKDVLNLPPSPPRLPIIGNLHQLGSLAHRSLQSLSEKYGPVMLLHFGGNAAIVVSSAEMAGEIMKTHDQICASRPPVSSAEMAGEIMKTHDQICASRPPSSMAKRLLYGSDIAFSPYSEYWRQLRRISVVHLLSHKRIQSFRLVREEEVCLIVEKTRASCNGSVNLSEMIVNLTNNIVCRVAIGRKYLGEEGEGYNFGEMLKELLRLAGSFPVRDFIPWLGWLDILSGLDARVRKCSREFDGFLERVIDEHKHYKVSSSNDGEESNFVDVLLSLNEKDGMAGISLTRDNMKAIILGYDLGWVGKVLIPDPFRRLLRIL